MAFKNKIALITGASEGIGRELADIMASDGWNVILTARRQEVLDEFAAQLTQRYGVLSWAIAADLSQPNAADHLRDEIRELGLTIDALINNAGFGLYGAFKNENTERIDALLQLNITALTKLTYTFLPDMTTKGQGWIMNVASTAGLIPMPFLAVYGASKAYVLSFSEALAAELEGSGVIVSCLAPGSTRTNFFKAAGFKDTGNYQIQMMDARPVARLGYDGMLQNKRLVLTGAISNSVPFLTRLFPRKTITDLMASYTKKRLLNNKA